MCLVVVENGHGLSKYLSDVPKVFEPSCFKNCDLWMDKLMLILLSVRLLKQ